MIMPLAAFGMIEILFLVGGGGLPLGVPPMDEDARLSYMAPEQCMLYLNWNGVASADPTSNNRTVKLLAETEVQALLSGIERELTAAFQREMARGGREEQVIAQHLPMLLKTLLTRPTAGYLASVKVDQQNRSVDVDAAAVVNTGKKTAEVRAAFMAIEDLIRKEMRVEGQLPVLPKDQGSLRVLPVERGVPQMAWGTIGEYFVFTVGGQAPAHVNKALTARGGKAPAWLTKLKKTLPVTKASMVTHIDLMEIQKTVFPLMGPMAGRITPIISALGFDKVESLGSVSGLNADGFASKGLISMTGDPSGLFALFRGKPLTTTDLKPIPHDASIAWAGRLNLADLYLELLLQLNKVDPNLGDEFTGEMVQMEREFGFKILEELLQPLGDGWCIYNSPGDGGLAITGLTLAVPVKDAKTLSATNQKFIKLLQNKLGQFDPNDRWRRGVFIKNIKHGENTIHMLNPIGVGDDMFIAPSWCVTNTHLYVAAFPQMVKAQLSREASAKSVADNPLVAEALKKRPSMVTFVDTPRLAKMVYPLIHFAAVVICSEIQREGIDIDASMLPSAPAILKHLKPDIGVVYRTKDGIVVESNQTLPTGGAGAIMPMMLMSTAGLSMARADMGRARDAHAMNNLRQIAIACLTYEADKGRLPNTLEDLKTAKIINRSFPLTGPRGRPLIYHLPGHRLRDIRATARTPMVSTQVQPRGYKLVVFADGHVERQHTHGDHDHAHTTNRAVGGEAVEVVPEPVPAPNPPSRP